MELKLKRLPWKIRYSDQYRILIDKTIEEQVENELNENVDFFKEEYDKIPKLWFERDVLYLMPYFDDKKIQNFNILSKVIDFANYIGVNELPNSLITLATEEENQDLLIDFLEKFDPTKTYHVIIDLIILLVKNMKNFLSMNKLFN